MRGMRAVDSQGKYEYHEGWNAYQPFSIPAAFSTYEVSQGTSLEMKAYNNKEPWYEESLRFTP